MRNESRPVHRAHRIREKLAAGESVDVVIMGDGGTDGPVHWQANADAPGFVCCDLCRVSFELDAGEWPNAPDARGCVHINQSLNGMYPR